MCLSINVFDMIKGDDTVFEKSTLRNLSEMHDLVAYRHNGFWQCMDTVREKERLEELWGSGVAPWKLW